MKTSRLLLLLIASALAACSSRSRSNSSARAAPLSSDGPSLAADPEQVPGLSEEALLAQDFAGIAHIRGANEHDLFFMQAWIHARDRLFQVDVRRHWAKGTLAEMLGHGALVHDVEYRRYRLYNAAQASLGVLSARPNEILEAYAAGVNAYVRDHPVLPEEYGTLGLTLEEWTAADSVVVLKGMVAGLSLDNSDISEAAIVGSGASIQRFAP